MVVVELLALAELSVHSRGAACLAGRSPRPPCRSTCPPPAHARPAPASAVTTTTTTRHRIAVSLVPRPPSPAPRLETAAGGVDRGGYRGKRREHEELCVPVGRPTAATVLRTFEAPAKEVGRGVDPHPRAALVLCRLAVPWYKNKWSMWRTAREHASGDTKKDGKRRRWRPAILYKDFKRTRNTGRGPRRPGVAPKRHRRGRARRCRPRRAAARPRARSAATGRWH